MEDVVAEDPPASDQVWSIESAASAVFEYLSMRGLGEQASSLVSSFQERSVPVAEWLETIECFDGTELEEYLAAAISTWTPNEAAAKLVAASPSGAAGVDLGSWLECFGHGAAAGAGALAAAGMERLGDLADRVDSMDELGAAVDWKPPELLNRLWPALAAVREGIRSQRSETKRNQPEIEPEAEPEGPGPGDGLELKGSGPGPQSQPHPQLQSQSQSQPEKRNAAPEQNTKVERVAESEVQLGEELQQPVPVPAPAPAPVPAPVPVPASAPAPRMMKKAGGGGSNAVLERKRRFSRAARQAEQERQQEGERPDNLVRPKTAKQDAVEVAGHQWCKKCAAVFVVGPSGKCPKIHASFMYSSKIPGTAAAATMEAMARKALGEDDEEGDGNNGMFSPEMQMGANVLMESPSPRTRTAEQLGQRQFEIKKGSKTMQLQVGTMGLQLMPANGSVDNYLFASMVRAQSSPTPIPCPDP